MRDGTLVLLFVLLAAGCGPAERPAGFVALEGAEAVDERTAVVKWKRPYVDADALFSEGFVQILPEHILGGVYAQNKAGFPDDPYWTDRFLGTGPYRLREWARGSHV